MDVQERDSLELTAWHLTYLATAYTRAKRLEALRESFHRELYETIVCSASTFDPFNPPHDYSPAVDTQAIRIIEAKARYEAKIRKEYALNQHWRNIFNQADEKDKQLMLRVFWKGRPVDRETLTRLLCRLRPKVEALEDREDKERHREAVETSRKQAMMTAWPRLPKQKTLEEFLNQKDALRIDTLIQLNLKSREAQFRSGAAPWLGDLVSGEQPAI